jgi:hypothetical protein
MVFVRAMRELAAVDGEIHFVMRHDPELILLEFTGKLLLADDLAKQGEIHFWIERATGTGGGFEITQDGLAKADRLPEQGPIKALEITMSRGYPIFTLRVE